MYWLSSFTIDDNGCTWSMAFLLIFILGVAILTGENPPSTHAPTKLLISFPLKLTIAAEFSRPRDVLCEKKPNLFNTIVSTVWYCLVSSGLRLRFTILLPTCRHDMTRHGVIVRIRLKSQFESGLNKKRLQRCKNCVPQTRIKKIV